MKIPDIQSISWLEVREQLLKVNPSLTEAIDSISPKDRCPIYKASYRFGESIIDKIGLKLPFNGTLLNIDDPLLPLQIREDLNYARLPSMVCLNKTAEMFVKFNERIFPIHLFEPGVMVGAWELLDKAHTVYQHNIWRIVAGARTLFLVPKVTDQVGHTKMYRALQLNENYPTHNLFNQGKIFAEIARSPQLNCQWKSDILLFSRDWFDLSEPKLAPFHQVVFKEGWQNTLHLRNQMTFEMVWQLLAQAQANTRLKPNVYVMDSVKHIVSIAAGANVGFAPVEPHDEGSLPLSTIQAAYLEYYGLKHYIPTILAPAYLLHKTPVYYSFLLPTLLSLSPSFNFRNTLENERNIKELLERFQQELVHHFPHYPNLLINQMKFEFFHFEADQSQNIHTSHCLPDFDSTLSHYSQDSQRIFCENGPFMRACVQISKAK